MNTWNINLDVSKGTAYNAPVIIGQGDKAGTTIRANIFDHGTQCDLSGMTAKFMLRAGVGYFEDAACTVSGSTITYVVDEEHAASVAGMAQAYFALYQGSTHVYSTSRFDVKVLRAASSGADPAQSYSDDIVAATQAARAAADAAEATVSAVEDAVEGIEDASDAAQQAVANAAQAVADATTAVASAQQALTDATAAVAATEGAAETANGAAARAEDAIDAIGDISELAVPLMSADVRGGAKLGEGLALTDGALGIDPAPHESTGEVRGSIAALTAKGHAEQVQTTGKNLCDTSTITDVTHYNATRVRNADGSVTISTGTNTTGTQLRYSCATTLLPAGTYMLSGCPSGGSHTTYMIYITDVAYDYGSGATFTLTEQTEVTPIILIRTGVTINATFYPQLEAGSEATDYEPYTNGPSPSPDWPQEIQVTRGRNLCPYLEQGYWAFADGNESSSALWVRTPKIGCDPDMDYTATSEYVTRYIGFVWYDKNGQYISSDNTNYGNNRKIEYKTKSPSNAAYMAFDVQGASGSSLIAPSDIKDLQINAGSVATPYVPYGHVRMEVQGKNLFDPSYLLEASGWTVSNGVYTGSTINLQAKYGSSNPYPINGLSDTPQSYTISLDYVPTNVSNVCYVIFVYTNGLIYASNIMRDANHYSFTSDESRVLTGIYFTYSSGQVISLSNIQLELGSTATDYEPYYHETRAIPLPQRGWVASLPDGTADVLMLDGAGKVEWTLPTKMQDLGDIPATAFSSVGGSQYSIAIEDAKRKAAQSQGMVRDDYYCTHFHFRPERTSAGDSILYDMSSNLIPRLHAVFGDDITSINTAKQWLADNNVVLLYPLATPVTEDCGYVDMPAIPGNCTVSIPELDALGVTYLIGDSVREMARQWYERARSEYEDRITALEAAVSEIIAG